MVLDRYRGGMERAFTPLAERALGLGLTPNAVTLVSLGFAVAAGVAFFLASRADPWLLLVGAALAGANAIADGLDGRMARISGGATRRGDYLDHVVDRYADLALLLGLTLGGFGDVVVGLFAVAGTLLTSYMGTQSQALGLGRNYRGLLGRADRVTIIISVPAIQGLLDLVGFPVRLEWNLVVLALLYIAVVGNLTALQRFWQGWRGLGS